MIDYAKFEGHTPGPWSLWTSNSVRRISARGDGDVVCAVRHNDGCADLYFKNGGEDGPNAALLVAAPELLAANRALQAEVDRLRRDCAEAYQVCGGALLGDDGKFWTDDDAERVLDNLSAAASGEPRPHDDLLPWPKDRIATEPP